MSYPRKLHLLIIEDEQEPIDTYRELLRAWQGEFPSVEPVVARSYADAVVVIEGEHPFHVVILDLNLPMATREVPPDGIAPGTQLLEMLARRDLYPVPVVLVVSGKLGLASLTQLGDRLEKDFWYGKMVNKGPSVTEDLRRGLQQALAYSDVGIHLRDRERVWFPVLSPREHDLLRRCILKQGSCLGVDLEWWGAEDGPSPSRPSAEIGPTKVLMGRFILDDGLGASLPTFFKFEPVGNAPYTCRDAGILDQKLSHVKVKCSAASRTRCILVTQSVTEGVPVPLSTYLAGDPGVVQPALPGIVSDVVDQLGRLGRSTEDQVPLCQFLWSGHRRATIEQTWSRPDIRSIVREGGASPLALFDQLLGIRTAVWACRRSCTHGDLNATNIAVENTAGGSPRAFIFDAGGVHADLDLRDLAVLEVTTLLFSDGPEVDRHFRVYQRLYTDLVPSPLAEQGTLPAQIRNILSLLSVIRGVVAKAQHPTVYPILVFDAALMQLGGLAIQPSPNKIRNPIHACLLASWVAAWVPSVVPALLGPPTEAEETGAGEGEHAAG